MRVFRFRRPCRAIGWLLFAAAFAAATASGRVVISEIQYDPVGGSTNEFIEILNAGTNAVDLGGWFFPDGVTYRFAAPAPLGAGAYLVLAADRAAFALRYPSVTNLAPGVFSGRLSNEGERLALADARSNVVFAVTYDNNDPWPAAAAGLGSTLVLVDPFGPADAVSNWQASAELHGSPGGPGGVFVHDIVINEVLAHTDPPLEDAIELRNLTPNAVSVAGWFLSDDNAARKKYRFPAGTVVPALGYVVVYQQQMLGADALVPFSISSKGDDVFLSEANAQGEIVRYVDQVDFEPTKNGVSFGRYPDGTGSFFLLATPTFGAVNPATAEEFRAGAGARNAGRWVGPVAINEIMYHPPGTNGPGRVAAEYVELLNTSASAVPLFNQEYPDFTWALRGGIAYDFPPGLVLNPGQFLLVVGTNDIAGFRQTWGLPANAVILGPFSNSLNNAGDTVTLRAPNNPELPANEAAYHVEDRVKYGDQLPWPLAADGLGGALERTDPQAYGNTAANWHSLPAGGTPGRANSAYLPPGSIVINEIMAVNRSSRLDEDGEASDWIELYNTTERTISLKGWHLTDQPGDPTLWTFPAVTVGPHGFLIVYASQKNRTNDVAKLHTNFALDQGGEYLALVRNDLVVEFAFDPGFPPQWADIAYGLDSIGSTVGAVIEAGSAGRCRVPTNAAALATNWTARTFDDAGWQPAGNGIGYDTDVTYAPYLQTDLRALMLNKNASGFVRYPFSVQDSGMAESMLLRLRYEDGFVAWLNGVRVAEANAPAAPAWNSAATAARSDALAVAVQDFSLSAFLHLLVDGTNVLAFQFMNNASSSSDLLLQPELQISWPGKNSGPGLVAGYLAIPSPASANGVVLPGVAPSPVFSPPGGVFSGALSVTLACARAEAQIRYSLDGSAPTTNSPLYAAPLEISTNSEVLARAFVPGWVASPVAGAVFRTAFLGINEIMADNVTAAPEIADFSDYPDWIELYNGSSNAVSVGGYYLTDNLNQPLRWAIPAGATIPARGHLLVWADGYNSRPGIAMTRTFWPNASFTTRFYHSNFKLASEGEEVGLFTPHGTRVDGVAYGLQQGDISYGRYPDGGTNWGYLGEATAGTGNRAPLLSHNLYRAPAVTIAPVEDALIVTGAVQVVLTSDPDVTAIRYTTNGAAPTSASFLYTGPFALGAKGVVRARAYAPDRHPGPIATRTYLRNARTPALPMLSLVIDPYLLYDSARGIYSNTLKDREIPGNLQFYTAPGRRGFQVDAGFRIFGLNSFMYAQKPFTVYLDSAYGLGELSYQLFPDKPLGAFDRFVLRNGNDDWPGAFLRDTLGQQMLNGALVSAVQGYVPCAMYLNGAYYGLMNIQEKMDEMYCSRNYGVPLEHIDFWENLGTGSGDLLDAGTEDAWNSILSYIASHSLAVATNYAYVKSQVDIEDLVDYVAGQTFVVDIAWNHNRKWWRDRRPGGRWRWCFVDLDRALNPGSVGSDQFSGLVSSQEIFRELLGNAEFKAYSAQRLMAHLSSSFSTNRIIPIINREAARIRSEIEQHSLLYRSSGGISSLATWDARIEEIRSYCRQRPAIAMQQVAAYYGGGQTGRMALTVEGGEGRVLANYVALLTNAPSTFVAGLPVQLKAVPAVGQRFVRWEIDGEESVSVPLVAAGSAWRYNDVVTNEIPGWTAPEFDDQGWLTGAGQLGYGDGDEATVIRYGPDANNKRISYYFRRAVAVSNVASFSRMALGLLRDDGAVVYVNGREVLRSNMPAGAVARTTLASSSLGAPAESAFSSFSLSPTNFVEGANLVAVEVHQAAANSGDLGFDLQLDGTVNVSAPRTNYSAEITLVPSAEVTVRAVFEPAGASLVPSAVASNVTLSAAASPWLATGDIFVPSNTTLRVESGATLLMPEGASLYVQGELRMDGTAGAPVRIACNTEPGARRTLTDASLSDRPGQRWGAIAFDHATHTGRLANVVIRGATLAGKDPVNMKAAISALASDLFMEGLDLDEVGLPVFVQEGRSVVLERSRLRLRETGDCINLKRTLYARVEGCDMAGALAVDADAIDYDGIRGGIIRGNWLHDFLGDNNDAIDTGEGAVDLLIESNLVQRCFDKAISVGQATTIEARNNLIRDVGIGVGVKDAGSFAWIHHNTFHQAGRAVAVYEKNPGAGGGAVLVRNCIFSESETAPVTVDSLSTADVSYCLSDTEAVPGVGNRLDEPQFENASADNFRLQPGSAAVDAGCPSDPPDADGSRTDMGAVPFDWREGHAVIAEIHYHPSRSNESEFIEILNVGGSALDVSGWRFSKGVQFEFPSGTVIPPARYLIVAAQTSGLPSTATLAWTSGVLDNAGESIRLVDAASNEMDEVSYLSGDPWPAEPDGTGPSLSLINPRWDNRLPENWYASKGLGGTPGAAFDNSMSGPVTLERAADGQFDITGEGLRGLRYRLEFSPSLTEPQWAPVSTLESTDGAIRFTHNSDQDAGFYRISVLWP